MRPTLSLTDTYAVAVSDTPNSERVPWITIKDSAYRHAIADTSNTSRSFPGICFHVTVILPDGPIYLGYARYGTFRDVRDY